MTQLDSHGAAILAFVERYWREHHRSPTYDEIGGAVGLPSKDHVSRDLKRLKQAGYLTYASGVSRSIVLLKTRPRSRSGSGTLPLPLASVPSQPLTTPDDVAPWLNLARGLATEGAEVYAMRVRGHAMRDALVDDGDVVVVERGHSLGEGELVAVWDKTQRQTTLKHFFRENGHARLQSANPEFPARRAPLADLEIQGKVLMIVRQVAARSNID